MPTPTDPIFCLPARIPDAPTLRDALERRRAALAAIPRCEILRLPGLQLDTIAGTIIGRLSQLAKVREIVAADPMLGERAAAAFDELAITAYAAEQTNVEVALARKGLDLDAASAELREAYEILHGDAIALANRKLLPRVLVDAQRAGSHRALVLSTNVLVQMFRDHWPWIEEVTPQRPEDLERAAALASAFNDTLSESARTSNVSKAIETRGRAMTILVHHYDEVRRIVGFVRWHAGDADYLAPSIWSGRRRRTKGTSDVGTDAADPGAPAAPHDDGDPTTH